MDEKRRVLFHQKERRWQYGYQPGVANPSSPWVVGSPITSLETTQSRGHAWPQAGRALTDIGGNFTTKKVVSMLPSTLAESYGDGFGYYYRGQEMAHNPFTMIDLALAAVTPSSEAYLTQKGTTAVARSLPTNPVVDGATFIGELKAGLPKLIGKELFKTKFKDIRKYGSEYLNVEFGWKPMISDLRKFAGSVIDTEKTLHQLERDSGKNIHRKFTFPDDVTSTVETFNNRLAYCNGVAVYPGCFHNAGGAPLVVTTSVTTKTWFSGCFTYYLKQGEGPATKINRAAAEARKLYGLELTPETIWNLTPWSWAVDWEGTMGDALHNISRFSQDGLVMRYGYIMQSKTAEVSATLHGNGRLYRSPVQNLTLTVIANSKVRRRATPFGFGFDMTTLDGRQSAILGALAISRGPRHL